MAAELKLTADGAVWFAPGQLLVFAPSKSHLAAETLLANLAKADFQPAGAELKKLVALTAVRAKTRGEILAKQQAIVRLTAIAATHEYFSWQLLSNAAAGLLDTEALTELTIAWNRPETAELLKGPGAAVVIRSWWAVAETARALPGEPQLASLAEFAGAQTRDAVKAAHEAVAKNPQEAALLASVVYAGLAERENAEVRAKTLAAVAKGSENANLSILVAALLDDPAKIDQAQLTKLLSEGIASGSDMTVLTAMACRRAGGEAWNTFRAQSRDVLGSQPLPGSVVVLVNHLATPVWPWLSGG
jgi:hypothetical protein